MIPGQKARAVREIELIREMRGHGIGAETAEIDVEVAVHRHKLTDLDTDCPIVQALGCAKTGRIVVARDVEPGEGRGQIEGCQVAGGQPGDHRQRGQHRVEREHGLDAFAGGKNISGLTEPDTVADERTDGAPWIGDRCFVGALRIQPSPQDGGDGAIEIGDRGEQSRPDLQRSGFGFAIIDRRMVTQSRPVEPCGDPAGAQIGLGGGARDRAAGMEQTARGFGGISGCSRGRGAGLGPARESQKPAGFVDRFTQIAEIAVMADQVQ